MSKVVALDTQIDDKYFLILTIEISARSYDYCMISVIPKSAIISSDAGSILNDEIKVISDRKLKICLDYPYGQSSLECIISFFMMDKLIDSESMIVPVKFKEPIIKKDFSIPVIRTQAKNFEDGIKSISSALNKGISLWEAELALKDGILVSFIRQSDEIGVFAFGEPSQNLMASDYLFQASKELNQFVIPIEIFWKNKDLYTQSKLGVYELVKADCITLKNYYFKRLISNFLDFDQLSKISPDQHELRSPTGEIFTPQGMSNG